MAVMRRDARQHGGTINARKRLEDEAGRRHQRARITCADAGLRLARFHQIDGDAHRRILLLAQRVLRALVHLHHLSGVANQQAVAKTPCVIGQQAGQYRLRTYQNNSQLRAFLQQLQRRGNAHGGPVIASHGVNRNRKARRVNALHQPQY